MKLASTVTLEIFAWVLFSELSENKPSQNGEITPLFTVVGKSCRSRTF